MNIQQADDAPWAKLIPLSSDKEPEVFEDGLTLIEKGGNWRIEKKPIGDVWIINLSASYLKVDSSWLGPNQEKQLFGGERLAFCRESKEEKNSFDYVFCLVDLQSKNKLKRNREDTSSMSHQKPPEKLVKVDNSIQESEIACSICLGILTRCTTLGPCGHNFCAHCLIEHLKYSILCPLCQKQIVSVIKNSALCNIIEAVLKNLPNLQRSSNEKIIPIQKDLEGNVYLNGSTVFIGSMMNGKKEGQGTLVSPSGHIYQCVWKNDLIEGDGVWILTGGRMIKGLWLNNQLQKRVEIEYGNGSFYKGEMISIQSDSEIRYQVHGRGFFKFRSGQTYEGEFRNHREEGFGKRIYAKGQEYEGEWKKGGRDGFGTMKYSDRGFYKGTWKNNKREGNGIHLLENGNKYEGNFKNHFQNGIGKYTWANGEEYEGNWIDSRRNGNGTMKYWDGCIFKGEWKGDKRNGKGVLILENGDKIEGYWTNDALHPLVKIEYFNGDRYEGLIQTETFKKHGKGILFFKNGGQYDSCWIDDKVDVFMENFLRYMMRASKTNFGQMVMIDPNLWGRNQFK